jgi:hypothetical protein
VLEVETRNFMGPRSFDNAGTPLHADNATVIKERIYRDKQNPDLLHDEMTTIDNALTRPWTVLKTYRRTGNPHFVQNICTVGNNHVTIGPEAYFLSADGHLMPTKKNQARVNAVAFVGEQTASSAADLKFLQRLQQIPLGTSNRKAALEVWSC